ncbi:MAG: hypothetical protein ACP5D2_04210 [Candidatus Nanoarchaeia archaeon]
MAEKRTHIQFFANRRDEGHKSRMETLRALEQTGSITSSSHSTSDCSALHYYPHGRKGNYHESYYGSINIKQFLDDLKISYLTQ